MEGEIERLAHGGEGVARVQGLVTFVPWTAPGDRVRGEVVERHPRWVRARPVEILAASPRRVTPGCPVFGACGGCQLQHLPPEDQRAAKAQAVEDALRRIGRVAAPPVVCAPAAAPWHYRRRITLTWLWRRGRLTLGFHAAAVPLAPAPPEGVVDVHACPIFAESGNARLARIREGLFAELAASGEGSAGAAGRLAVRALGPDQVQCGVFADDPGLAERLARAAGKAAGIPATWGRWTPGGPPVVAPGAPRLPARIVSRGLDLRAGFDSFLQADLSAAETLYDAVLEDLGPAPERVIDGYAGIGVLTCRLAAGGAAVTAVESHPGAASDLRANAAAQGSPAAGRIHVLELPIERMSWRRPDPTAIVLNPPRTGVPPRVLEAITRTQARRLVYVACDPTTLARDLRRLVPAWRLVRARAFDMFPQTAHVETVAAIER